MGRPEKSVPRPKSALGKLAAYLREIRSRNGFTYDQLKSLTGLSTSSLSRAASGKELPSLRVVRAFNEACAGHEDVTEMWKRAFKEGRLGGPTSRAPRVPFIRDRADLSAALREIYVDAGAPSTRAMEERAETRAREFGPLARMTAYRIREQQAVPSSELQLRAFLVACDVPDPKHGEWVQAWARAKRHQEEMDAMSLPEVVERPADLAVQDMIDAGFRPTEPYDGPTRPWACKCRKCGGTMRMRFVDVAEGNAKCAVCTR